jgi:hypothetical protein
MFMTSAAIGLGVFVGVFISSLVPALRNATTSAFTPSAPVVVTEAMAAVTSNPPGAEVLVDGTVVGTAPISLSLRVGGHKLELRSGPARRELALTVEAGKIVSQHVDFALLPSTGRLEVASDPPGAVVSLDGTRRGTTPLVVDEVPPGRHRVALSNGRTTVNRTVDLKPGATASIVISIAAPGAATGWVSIETPFEVQVLESGKALGTGSAWRLLLPAGRHELDLVSRSFDFRTTSVVNVVRDRTVPVSVPLPNGSLSLNALPWADVWLDGKPVGTTPLGNLPVTVGSHEVTWRHPQFGERRQTVSVGATTPVRIGIDWSR